MSSYRPSRFLGTNSKEWSLVGDYQRLGLFEPSLKAMCLSLSEIKKVLQSELNSNNVFKQAWDFAEIIYNKKSASHPKMFLGAKEHHIAVIIYALENPNLYIDFNEKCQKLESYMDWHKFEHKSLFYLLIQAEMRTRRDTDLNLLERSSHLKDNANQQQEKTVYRSLTKDISIAHLKPRDLIAFNQFLSTTMDQRIAWEAIRKNGGIGTLLEIQQLSWSSKDIDMHSTFPMEKEVVIFPWIKFYVEKIENLGTQCRRVILKPTSKSFVDIS